MDVSKLTLQIFSELEQKWLMEWENANSSSPNEDDTNKTKTTKTKKTCILSIDGGFGIKGLVAGEALIHLEDRIQSHTSDQAARIADHFDLIAGTGIGGILAVLLAVADPSGRPLFSARDAVRILRRRSGGLFRRRRKFYGGGLESLLRDSGRCLTMRDTCRPLLVPCYDLDTSAPFVFSRADATRSQSFDFELWRVCRATSATPGVVRPYRVASVDGRSRCTAVDGGVAMNNPSAAAVTHVLHNRRDFPSVSGVEDLVLLSLGNGGGSRRPAVTEIMLDGVSEAVDQSLCIAFGWNRGDYIRIQGNGTGEDEEGSRRTGERMLKERGVVSLPFGGKRLLTETNGERIDRLVQQLLLAHRG